MYKKARLLFLFGRLVGFLNRFRVFAIIYYYSTVVVQAIVFKDSKIRKSILKIVKQGIFTESDEYYLYLLGNQDATIAIPHMFTHSKPSFLLVTRNRNINYDFLPKHVLKLTDPQFSFTSIIRIHDEVVKQFSLHIAENPSAVLHVMGTFESPLLFAHPFFKYGVSMNNYTRAILPASIRLLSVFSTIMQNAEVFAAKEKAFLKDYHIARKSRLPIIGSLRAWYNPSFFVDVACCTVFDNISCWSKCKQFLPEPIHALKHVADKLVIISRSGEEIVSGLSDEEKKSCFELIGIDIEYYDKLFYQSSPSKKSLIVTDSASILNKGRFHLVLEQIVSEYGDDYNIFYKPHPKDRLAAITEVSGETESSLKKHGIVELPSDIPVDAILIAYPSVYVGGYVSAFYCDFVGERVLFFISEYFHEAPSADEDASTRRIYEMIVKVYKTLYDQGAYPNARILWR